MMMSKYKPSFYRKLASHLMMVMTIPNDNRMVMVFGKGTESCNLDAIAGWIQSLEHEVDLEDAANRLSPLAHAAANRIEGSSHDS
jgi:hypothetical protein